MKENFKYLEIGSSEFDGKVAESIDFVIQKQLKDRVYWKKFVNVFRTKEDVADEGWRGEYFGKMMRGACLTYRYNPDEELYMILEDTVRDLLSTQDKAGRISTYTVEAEFHGWDMWSRKYVLVGCLYFYEICKDKTLKDRIITAMCAHVDYLVGKIGRDKVEITETSEHWGGVNSCTILEPVLHLYKLTKKEEYLRFAEYIISTGGCKDGNLLEIAEKGELLPYQYPEVKAYETMSFFEGVLAYYEVTGKEKYFDIVKKFVNDLLKSEITIVGSAGCTEELFDNAAVKQANDVEDLTIMQETCVTVTWMRLNERLLRLTGDSVYADNIEKSARNALYGSMNIYGNKQFSFLYAFGRKYMEGLPFDSYSPLVNQPRGVGIGGQKAFKDGGYYGCCACIAAAGIALFPLSAILKNEDGFYISQYFNGKIKAKTPSDNDVSIEIKSDAAEDGRVSIIVCSAIAEKYAITLRIPEWSNNAEIKVNGTGYPIQNGNVIIEREWKGLDEIDLAFNPEIKSYCLSGKIAFVYGGLVLARDMKKENKSITDAFTPIVRNGKYVVEKTDPQTDETVRFILKTKDGGVLLTDYASCGKHWEDADNSRISVWLNKK